MYFFWHSNEIRYKIDKPTQKQLNYTKQSYLNNLYQLSNLTGFSHASVNRHTKRLTRKYLCGINTKFANDETLELFFIYAKKSYLCEKANGGNSNYLY